MHKTMKTKLNTLPPTIKISTGFTDVMCMNTRVGSVICKPSQNFSRCVPSFKDSSVLLNI